MENQQRSGARGLVYGSLCSGIEAASVAWEPLGWRAAFFSEIEPFPGSVLKQRFPNVANLGDMTKYQEWPHADLDLLVGGTPCQAFSVAGLREGLADPRGNLMLTFAAIARRYRPRWVVWENVPGVLSSGDGRDFGSLLGVLSGRSVVAPAGAGFRGDEQHQPGPDLFGDVVRQPAAEPAGDWADSGWKNCGVVPGHPSAYGLAWRVLDAQYFGVAQRRRRVFVVGHLGDWRPAAAVLLERASLRGDPPPERRAREGSSARARGRAGAGGNGGDDFAGTITARGGSHQGTSDHLSPGHLIVDPPPVVGALNAGAGRRVGAMEVDAQQILAVDLYNQTADDGEAGPAHTMSCHGVPAVMAANGAGGGAEEELAPTLPGDHLDRPSDTTPLVFAHEPFSDVSGALHTMLEPHGKFTGDGNDTRLVQVTPINQDAMRGGEGAARPGGGSGVGDEGDPAGAVLANKPGAVAYRFSAVDDGRDAGDEDMAPTLRQAGDGGHGQALAVALRGREGGNTAELSEVPSALRASGGGSDKAHALDGMQVRRLTPLECERLQGFPDGWTAVDHRGSAAADGPRYKAIGNSMAVPVMRWIGERIACVEAAVAGEPFRLPEPRVHAFGKRINGHGAEPYVVRTHNLHDEKKGDVWLSDVPGALNATGATPNQFDAVAIPAEAYADELLRELPGVETTEVRDAERQFVMDEAGPGEIGLAEDGIDFIVNADAPPQRSTADLAAAPHEGVGQGDAAAAHPGRCARRHVTCTIVTLNHRAITGTNECANPQPTCPRAPGEDYTKCRTVCRQRGHAEVVALEKAREAGFDLRGGMAVIVGHDYFCQACGVAMREAGLARIQVNH